MPGRLAVFPLLLVLFFTACENPTGVGSGLVDDEGGRPREIGLTPTEMAPAPEADVTGGSASGQRILVGVTDDPALGRIQATGHIDFLAPFGDLSEAFAGNPITSASLILIRGYSYGDGTSTISVRINDLDDEWTAAGRRADTTLAPGSLASEYSFPAGSSVVEIPLSAEWISRWTSALKDDDFGTLFHGFRIEATSGDAVLGYEQTGSSLRAVAGGDTTFYLASRTLTSMAFQPSSSLPGGTVLLQDSRSAGTVVRFDFDDDTVTGAALSRARVEVPYDSSLTTSAPEGYVRPPMESVELFAVSVDPPDRLSVAVGFLDDGVIRFESDQLLAVIRQAVERDSPLDHFELSADPDRTSLDVLLLGQPVAEGPGARALLTVVPFE